MVILKRFYTSPSSGVVLLTIVLLFFSWDESKAQNTIITLVDSTKIKTDIITVSNKSLFTSAGSFNLTEIYSVRFLTDAEYRKRISSAIKLLDLGVIVYVTSIQQTPSDPIKVAANRSQLTDQDSVVSENRIEPEKVYPISTLGLGIGLDYGGFGARVTVLPANSIALFVGAGYALAGFGYNFGIIGIANNSKRFSPTATVMYGYNAAIAVANASQYNKVYYGPSIGLGFMLKNYSQKKYWHFELIIPFRPTSYDTDLASLKNNPNIKFDITPPSVLFAVGYHFGAR